MGWWPFGKKKTLKRDKTPSPIISQNRSRKSQSQSQSQSKSRSNSLNMDITNGNNVDLEKDIHSYENIDDNDIFSNLYINPSNNNVYILAVSHNTRMQCMLGRLLYLLGHKVEKSKIRLQNCAILQFIFAPNVINISLVYNGELHIGTTEENDKDAPRLKRQYYTNNIDKIREGCVIFEPITIKVNETTYRKLGLNRPGNTTIVLLERHAQGIHNTRIGEREKSKNQFKDKYTDAILTPQGETQAQNSGIFLKKYLRQVTQPIYFCASNLFRAQQTIGYVIKELYPKLQQPKPITISVVPCLHEVNKSSSSMFTKYNYNCDTYMSNSRSLYLVPVENKTKYNIQNDESNFNSNKLSKIIGKNVIVDWSDYNMFYIQKSKCRDKIAFAQIFICVYQKMIEYEERVITYNRHVKNMNNQTKKNRSTIIVGKNSSRRNLSY